MDSHPLLSRTIVAWLSGQGAYARECAKTSRPATKATLISGTIFWTRRTRLQAHIPFCTQNGRILLVNLFPRNTAALAMSGSLCSWAFNDSICEGQFSALRG